MANRYVSSVDGADPSGTSVSWWNGSQTTYATIAGANAAASAGDRIIVDDAHDNQQEATIVNSSSGTAASPCEVVVVDRGTGVAVTTPTATEEDTGTGSGTSGTFSGFQCISGMRFLYGRSPETGGSRNVSMFASTSSAFLKLLNCYLKLGRNDNSDRIAIGVSNDNSCSQKVEWYNVDLEFSDSGQFIILRGRFLWQGGSLIAGSIPTILFQAQSANDLPVIIRGVDLSVMVSGDFLVGMGVACSGQVTFDRCKLGSGVVAVQSAFTGPAAWVRLSNCDSGDSIMRDEFHCYMGAITNELTIVRTGGATMNSTPYSKKLAASADAEVVFPLADDEGWFAYWNDDLSSPITLSVEVVNDGLTLEDDEAWLECRYLGTSGFPIESFATSKVSNSLATPTAWGTSSESWTTTGLASPVKQTLEITVTPEEVGWIFVRPVVARPSIDVYVCPQMGVA